ncbi:hypothetical protein [Leifsonia sp. NPDC080035]|uniref:ParB-like C-terminal domain-containing protein n=1 Tax=Leifsonia sp. NPDC080035 TaxID=3143936 RepID=A0AAU7GGC7_9MICO
MSLDDEATPGATAAEFRLPSATVAEPSHRIARTTVTFYLPDELRNRARAAYRSTSNVEGDRSWSEMVGKALLAEVQRRETLHNGGRAFIGSDAPLPPGRPIGD